MRTLARAKRLLQQDDIRTTLQTAVAVLIAYCIMALTGLDSPSWAVFSALFVVQANVGGTIGSALWRIAGALLGAAIAVVLMTVLHGSGWQTVAAMLFGVSAMSLLSLRYPDLSYGLVTVTIITVAPDFYVIEGALSKVIAIAIGSCSAILACLAVLPVSAYRSADHKVAEAIRLCGHAIADCLSCTTDGEARKKHEAEHEVSRRLRDAYLVWQQASMEKIPPAFVRLGRSRCTLTLLHHAQRLQENLTLAERFSDRPLPAALSQQHKDRLNALGKAIEQRLEGISNTLSARQHEGLVVTDRVGRDNIDSAGKAALRGGEAASAQAAEDCARADPYVDTAAVWERYRSFAEEADRSASSLDAPEEREHLLAIKWACSVILHNIEAITSELEKASRPSSQARARSLRSG